MPDPELTDEQKEAAAAAEAAEKGKKGKTAAETVQGGKTAREIQLEKEISTLQDKNTGLETQITDLTKLVEGARKAPSGKGDGKTLLDELNEFMGLGS